MRTCDGSFLMSLQSLRQPLEPLLRRLFHVYWRFARGLTLGVRAVVIDGAGRVFLIKHSYVAGWHLPGGGVEVGETLMTALTRELREEGNIELGAEPAFFAIYFNRRALVKCAYDIERDMIAPRSAPVEIDGEESGLAAEFDIALFA